MSKLEPPPLASWLLEHAIPGQRDQAVAGDLLEEFQCGRSNGWYWRQALAAWVVGWSRYLGTRAALIVFAALWSLLAPGWTLIVDRLVKRDVPWPVSVAEWLTLNLIFVWAGMLVFAVMHRRASLALNVARLWKAVAIAAAVFLPAYCGTFVLSNLFAWPGLAVNWRGMTPLGAMVDLRPWADALRVPYIVTLLGSMWSLTPALDLPAGPTLEWRTRTDAASVGQSDGWEPDAAKVAREMIFLVCAGLLNALIAGFVLCRLPEDHHPTLGSVAFRAVIYVAIGGFAGMIGSYIYWHHPSSSFRAHSPVPFPLFAAVCSAGWIWVPAMVLFSEQVSALSAVVAAIGALLLAGEIRRIWLVALAPGAGPEAVLEGAAPVLFSGVLYRAPAQPEGYLVALCVYGAGWAVAERSNMAAEALLAMAACLFKLRTTLPAEAGINEGREYRRAALRLAALLIPAILVTFWSLLDGVAHRNGLAGVSAAGARGGKYAGEDGAPVSSSSHTGAGYESVILWPSPPKKEVLAPVEPKPLLAPGTTQPLVIRFTGEYWYLQPPDVRPGARAHKAVGTPLDFHIATSNSFPLIMQAHQYLRSPLQVTRCREIRVTIDHRETEPGAISVSVWLRNSSAGPSPGMFLGQEPLTHVSTGRTTAETLIFAVPATAKMRVFDEIAVMVAPDSDHRSVGPRVAIDQFELVPR